MSTAATVCSFHVVFLVFYGFSMPCPFPVNSLPIPTHLSTNKQLTDIHHPNPLMCSCDFEVLHSCRFVVCEHSFPFAVQMEKHVCRWTHLWDHCASSSGLGSSQCDVEKEKPAKDVARDSQDNKSQAMTQSRQSGLSTIFQFLFLMHTPQINNKASWDLMSQEVKFAPLVILVTIPPLAYDDNAVWIAVDQLFPR